MQGATERPQDPIKT